MDKDTARSGAEHAASSGDSRDAASPSMANHVTRHALVTDGPRDWRFLTCGIDSLDLGIYVRWDDTWPEIEAQLEERRTAANGTRGILWRESELGPCLVWPSGKQPMYRYHVQLPDAHIYIQATQEWKGSPNIFVSLSARSLWSLGVRDAVEVIVQLLRELGASIDRVQVSRVDLAMDYVIEGGLSQQFIQSTLVSRSELVDVRLGGGVAETMYIGGEKCAIRLRLYNKSKEVLAEGEKLWFAEIWRVDVIEDIWRAEFQLRRRALKQYGVESVNDLVEKAAGIWSDLTSKWASLRLQDAQNTSRRTFHPWWQAVHEAASSFGPLIEVKRSLSPFTTADVTWYVAHIAGCLVGLAVRLGVPTLVGALLAVRQLIVEYWRERDWDEAVETQRIRLGLEVPIEEDFDAES